MNHGVSKEDLDIIENEVSHIHDMIEEITSKSKIRAKIKRALSKKKLYSRWSVGSQQNKAFLLSGFRMWKLVRRYGYFGS